MPDHRDHIHAVAAFRKGRRHELAELAEKHLQQDMRPEDRQLLKKATDNVSVYTSIGTALGVGAGLFLAFRFRQARIRTWEAFKTREKPVAVKFADGREETIPDVSNLVRPSTLGDAAAYFFFTMGGLFVGGETGLLFGSMAAGRTITRDAGARERIETAFRKFRAETLRREADLLDGGDDVVGELF